MRKIYTCIIFLVQFYLVVFFIFCLVYNDIFYWIIKGWKGIGFFYWLKIIKENILENNRYHLIFILEFL
ncbi:ATPase, partial [Fusobacterium animalis ATCC 51191]